jgi:hypothetical protein
MTRIKPYATLRRDPSSNSHFVDLSPGYNVAPQRTRITGKDRLRRWGKKITRRAAKRAIRRCLVDGE